MNGTIRSLLDQVVLAKLDRQKQKYVSHNIEKIKVPNKRKTNMPDYSNKTKWKK